MKRQNPSEPDIYVLKLRKQYARFSTSAWGCRRKKYPVVCISHASDQNAVGHIWKDIDAAAFFFGLSYHKLHKMIENGTMVDGEYTIQYRKFL
jgi:hypothetical protein